MNMEVFCAFIYTKSGLFVKNIEIVALFSVI